jgi:hypothetical protein
MPYTKYFRITFMAQLGDAVTRYHKLFEQDEYRNPVWAEQLQERMRQLHLTESGRILTPILRPHFVSRRQLDLLTRTTAHLAEILDRVEAMVFASPPLLNRLQMLPAEKMLAAVPCGYSRFNVTASIDVNMGAANIKNGSLILQGINACKPAGLAYANLLAELFLELPIVKEFKRNRYKLSKLGGTKVLLQAIQAAWREFDHGKTKPTIAIVEMGQEPGAAVSEGHLIAESLSQQGATVRLIPPERLQYSGGKLHSGDFAIDVVFRRVLTRELLTRFELSHALLEAYRNQSVCVINSFRSEFAQRRSLFDLLTDETVTAGLSTADRKLIQAIVPWTRIVSARKTKHFEETIDLPEFILRHREELTLLPMEDGTDQRIYMGKAMNPLAWDRAVHQALRSPYVVQARPMADTETFPAFQYGELKMKIAEVTVHPHIFNGQMNDASAILHSRAEGSAAQLAVAPVLLLEEA